MRYLTFDRWYVLSPLPGTMSKMLTAQLIYFFLVERVVSYLFPPQQSQLMDQYIVRRNSKPRFKDRLYMFNTLGMLSKFQ